MSLSGRDNLIGLSSCTCWSHEWSLRTTSYSLDWIRFIPLFVELHLLVTRRSLRVGSYSLKG